jgi:hypothetical protein
MRRELRTQAHRLSGACGGGGACGCGGGGGGGGAAVTVAAVVGGRTMGRKSDRQQNEKDVSFFLRMKQDAAAMSASNSNLFIGTTAVRDWFLYEPSLVPNSTAAPSPLLPLDLTGFRDAAAGLRLPLGIAHVMSRIVLTKRRTTCPIPVWNARKNWPFSSAATSTPSSNSSITVTRPVVSSRAKASKGSISLNSSLLNSSAANTASHSMRCSTRFQELELISFTSHSTSSSSTSSSRLASASATGKIDASSPSSTMSKSLPGTTRSPERTTSTPFTGWRWRR